MLNIYVNKITPEINYSIHLLVKEFLGIQYIISENNLNGIQILRNDKIIELDDSFFQIIDIFWGKDQSLPRTPLERFDLKANGIDAKSTESTIPVLYGKPFVTINQEKIVCGIDIFGSAFFMLSRYEELVNKERDQYRRVFFYKSLTFK